MKTDTTDAAQKFILDLTFRAGPRQSKCAESVLIARVFLNVRGLLITRINLRAENPLIAGGLLIVEFIRIARGLHIASNLVTKIIFIARALLIAAVIARNILTARVLLNRRVEDLLIAAGHLITKSILI